MKRVILSYFILATVLLSGCRSDTDVWQDDNTYVVSDVLYPENAKLKQELSKHGGDIWYVVTDYEYDNLGRISKVSRPMYEDGKITGLYSYSIYAYNAKSQLEKITYFHSNLNVGFLNLETYTHSYDNNGNKLKTLIEYPQINRTDSILYFYDKNRLVRENKYDSGIFYNGSTAYTGLVSYTVYEYDNQGHLVKETNYSGIDNTPLGYSTHSYQNGLNVKTETFTYYNMIGETKLREVKRFYDTNRNLIYFESKELSMLSSMSSYEIKYEYY